MKHKSFAKKATNSFVGRILRRLLGEERGTVMMEYVVIGLLIAAVAVVAVSAFGGYISELFGVLAHSAGGASTSAEQTFKNADDKLNSGLSQAKDHSNKMRDSSMEESDVTSTSRVGGASSN